MELFTNELDLDLQILQYGPISMYLDQTILDQDLKVLQGIDYRIIDFDTTNWTIKTAHIAFQKGLDFPEYYGKNLDAFDDCLEVLSLEVNKGIVIVLRHFDQLAKTEKKWCEGLLDVISEQSRQWLLTNKRLIGLVQTDRPNLQFSKLGGLRPTWNRREWLAVNRRKK